MPRLNSLLGALAGTFAIALLLCLPARAELVIDGETITDAATFDAAKKEGRLLLYGTYPGDAMSPIIAAFQSDTGLKVDFVRLPTQNMFQRVVSEFAAKKLEADYIDLADLTLVQQLIDRGILNVPHKVPAFDRIPAEIKNPEGRWYGIIRPVSVIGVNKSRVADADLPKSWNDLLGSQWKGGLIGAPSVDAGGSAFTMYAFLRTKIDPGFWKKFAAQAPHIYPAISPVATDLARGEVAIGIGALGEQTALQIKAGAPLTVIFPTEGIMSFALGGGISTTAKNPNAAALFLDWMTSRRGGNVIAAGGAYPANATANRPNVGGLEFPPADQVWNMRIEDWIETRDAAMTEWRQIFGGH